MLQIWRFVIRHINSYKNSTQTQTQPEAIYYHVIMQDVTPMAPVWFVVVPSGQIPQVFSKPSNIPYNPKLYFKKVWRCKFQEFNFFVILSMCLRNTIFQKKITQTSYALVKLRVTTNYYLPSIHSVQLPLTKNCPSSQTKMEYY